jgi:hypothetical protein
MRLKSQNWEKLEGSFMFHPINILVFEALLTLKQIVDKNHVCPKRYIPHGDNHTTMYNKVE